MHITTANTFDVLNECKYDNNDATMKNDVVRTTDDNNDAQIRVHMQIKTMGTTAMTMNNK